MVSRPRAACTVKIRLHFSAVPAEKGAIVLRRLQKFIGPVLVVCWLFSGVVRCEEQPPATPASEKKDEQKKENAQKDGAQKDSAKETPAAAPQPESKPVPPAADKKDAPPKENAPKDDAPKDSATRSLRRAPKAENKPIEVIVTAKPLAAQRVAGGRVEVRDATSSVDIIDEQTLNERVIKNVDEALRTIPGVDVTTDGYAAQHLSIYAAWRHITPWSSWMALRCLIPRKPNR